MSNIPSNENPSVHSSEDLKSPGTISARHIKIAPSQPQPAEAPLPSEAAALALVPFDFVPVPIDPETQQPPVDVAFWPDRFSATLFEAYRLSHPQAQFALSIPENSIVLGAPTEEIHNILWDILRDVGLAPLVTIQTGTSCYYAFALDGSFFLSHPAMQKTSRANQIAILLPGQLLPLADDAVITDQSQGDRSKWHEVTAENVAPVLRFNREVVDAAEAKREAQMAHPLKAFALSSDVIKQQISEATEVLPGIALRGQTTVIFAPPNTGKTLLILYLLLQAIKADLLSAKHVFYLNVDDNVQGLYEKALLAERYGFHMLAEGFEGFQVKFFVSKVRTIIDTGLAPKTVIILDTLKRFTDVMDKRANSEFTGLMRQFAVKGGTVIQLGHTNKNRGPNGKATFAGTSDLVDDVDCAYMLDEIKVDREAQRKIVEFRRLKSRGSVSESVVFSYSIADGMDYPELLASVEELDPASLEPLLHELSMERDQPVIDAIEDLIRSGSNAKMQIVTGAARTTKVGQRGVAKVLDRYTGEIPGQHRWTYVVGARGARLYTLLSPPADADVT